VFPAGGGQLRYAISLGQKMKITEGRLRAGGAADRPEVAQAELAGRLDQDLPRPAVPDKPETTVDPEVVRIRSALLDDGFRGNVPRNCVKRGNVRADG
jgi:hypothetical protein